MSADRPTLLIVGNDGYTWAAENQSNAKADDNFRVGEMRNDLADRPFLWGRTLAQSGSGDALDKATELRGGCSLRDERLLAFHVAKNALRVLLRCFVHFVLLKRPSR